MQAKRRSLEEPGDLRSRLPWAQGRSDKRVLVICRAGFRQGRLGRRLGGLRGPGMESMRRSPVLPGGRTGLRLVRRRVR
ncbi:MAG TPA: hypothetical protein VIH20_03425, partial [Candidatus Subteraquimicrobiales bacterium]